MLIEFGRASLVQKARQQPGKVQMVLDKARVDGLKSTVEAVRSQLDELRHEVQRYERLRSGGPKTIHIDSLDELPRALGDARVTVRTGYLQLRHQPEAADFHAKKPAVPGLSDRGLGKPQGFIRLPNLVTQGS